MHNAIAMHLIVLQLASYLKTFFLSDYIKNILIFCYLTFW